MKNKINYISSCCLWLVFFLISGCSTRQSLISRDLEKSFQNQVGIIEDMNVSLGISLSGTTPNVFGSAVELRIQNKSQNQIFLTNDYENKLFIIRDGKWIQIQNSDRYHGDGFALFPNSSGEIRSEFPTEVRPVLDSSMNTQKKETLRIFVEGKLMKDGKLTDVSVGAYVDVGISP